LAFVAHPGIRYRRKDLERLPPDWRAELVDGVLVMPPAPDPFRGSVVIDLAAALLRYLGPRFVAGGQARSSTLDGLAVDVSALFD